MSIVIGAAPWSWFLVRDINGRMDAVALLWPVLAGAGMLVLLFASVLMRRPGPAVAALSWALAFLVVIVLPWRPLGGPAPVEGLRVVAANTFGINSDRAPIGPDLLARRPHVLVISEISDRLHRELSQRFRYASRSLDPRFGTPGDVSVYSDLPLDRSPLPAPIRAQKGMRVVVDAPSGPLVLYALHLQKPGATVNVAEIGFRMHRRLIRDLAAAVEHEDWPVVVAGDLNVSDRTTGYRKLVSVLDDAMRADWVQPTARRWTTRPLLARIDHIFMPEDWCSVDSETFKLHGSDHRGIATTLGRCP